MEEIEVKFLDIDPKKLKIKLKELGAKKVFSREFRRKLFDYPDWRLDKAGAWIRLRDEGPHVTLSLKQRLGIKSMEGRSNDSSMEEIETSVGDFDKIDIFLKRIGLVEKRYSENRRERYTYKNITFDIDYWPLIPPYLEIEAPSWKEIEKAIHWLGLNPADKKIFSAKQVYELYGIDENDYSLITFDEQIKKPKK